MRLEARRRRLSPRTAEAYAGWVRQVLKIELGPLGDAARASASARHLPVVLSRAEIRAVLAEMSGSHRLAAIMMYGGGLRLMETLRLRVKDGDFARQRLVIRRGKGGRDQVTTLPIKMEAELRAHLADVRRLDEVDPAASLGPREVQYELGGSRLSCVSKV